MPHSNRIVPLILKISPDKREAFFRVENHKGWPTADPVEIVEKHRDAEVEQVGQGRFRVTWGDRAIPEPLWIRAQAQSYGREHGTVRLIPVDAEGAEISFEADGGEAVE